MEDSKPNFLPTPGLPVVAVTRPGVLSVADIDIPPFDDITQSASPVEETKMASVAVDVHSKPAGGLAKTAMDLPSKSKTSPFNPTLAYLTFMFVGANSLINWIFVMQTIPFIAHAFLDDQDWNNTLLGSFQAIEVVVQLAMLELGSTHVNVVCLTGVINALAGLLIVPLTLYTSKTVAVWMLHLVCLVLGACSGVYQGSGYAIASMMPRNFVSAVSTGQGLAGMFVFVVVIGASFAIFDVDTAAGTEGIVWTGFTISAILSVLCAASFFVVMRKSWAVSCLERVRAERRAKRDAARACKRNKAQQTPRGGAAESPSVESDGYTRDQSSAQMTMVTMLPPDVQEPRAAEKEEQGREVKATEGTEGPAGPFGVRPWPFVLKAALPWLFMLILHMFISFHLFPKVGPLSWNYENPPKNYLVILFGIFYVAEFIGRSLPDLCTIKGLGFLHLPRRAFVIAELARLLFFIPFVLGYAVSNVPFVNNFYWYCCLIGALSLTQGWLGTLAFYYAVNSVESPTERELTGPMAAIASPFGCVIGLYTAAPY
ncbi:putative adenosine transporter [Neospora caninum Liverpool]|uniref:Adenosine transporter, putative n=1 Tax=Neospora caninum (strain Liverpool) TaxID=572307 RepID=F0VIE5_NEOCL|nr:putative adenosine transporter [Neospora caninum Liverpool]CBZ53506.1 putative adenosine transporter [Neospora caninum Liverpool]CEL67494.1 TPA: adenosine transporter, putative [Neospora caninum Liverpool]|eukprot:XP_003883538.1 putative adenosine transporter [Neospora caninum Liverpool]